MQPKYKLIAYHCPYCGAPTDPNEGQCKYCNRIINLRIYLNKRRNVRVLFENNDNFVYFDRITSITAEQKPEMIEASMLDDTTYRYIPARQQDFLYSVGFYLDKRSIDLMQMIQEGGIINTRFELLEEDRAFEMKSYIGDIYTDMFEPNTIAEGNINIISAGEMKMFNTVIPQKLTLTCPNCGGEIHSRYGACDYCGGWVEYMF